LDGHGLVKLAYFLESYPNGRAMVDAVLDAIEENPSLPPDYLARIIASLKEPPERKEPANDKSERMSSSQRRARYAELVSRDGQKCSDCGCGEQTIWRRQGVWSNEFGRYTKVHPTSNLEVDHKQPLWAGGNNDIENLWLLCIDCHKRKTAAEASQRRRA
jgi:5-methylcytosine-specific restriction endonuclease McrA